MYFFHAIVTFLLTGLIWTIQIVHYPIFRFLDSKTTKASMLFHQRRISLLVMPLMLCELGSAIYLVWKDPNLWVPFHATNIFLLVCIWLLTAIVLGPTHMKMVSAFSSDKVKKLTIWNWPRTILWTLKSMLWIWALWHIITML